MLSAAAGILTKRGRISLKVIEIQLEETIKLGTLETFLEDAGYDLNTSQSTLRLDKQVVAFNQRTVTLTDVTLKKEICQHQRAAPAGRNVYRNTVNPHASYSPSGAKMWS